MLSIDTVHIVGGDNMSRLAISEVLPAGLQSASYLSPETFLQEAPVLSPGCVLLLVEAPSKLVLRIVAALRQLGSDMPMVVIGPRGSVEIAVQSLKDGAADFLEVTAGKEALYSAVEVALGGGSFRLPESELTKAKSLVETLTPREHEVLKGISAGLSSKTIAKNLHISHRTVEVHRRRLMSRLRVPNAAAAIRIAVLADLASVINS